MFKTEDFVCVIRSNGEPDYRSTQDVEQIVQQANARILPILQDIEACLMKMYPYLESYLAVENREVCQRYQTDVAIGIIKEFKENKP